MKPAVIIVLLQTLALGAFADLTMVIENDRPGMAPLESTLFASSGNWRLENAEGGFLHAARQDGYFALTHPSKTYRQFHASAALLTDNLDELIWKKTGETGVIAGLRAQHWKAWKGGTLRAEVWFGGEKNFFEDLADETQGIRGPALQFLPSIPGRFPVHDGYILKFIDYDGGHGARIMQVKTIDKKPVDAKWFQLPVDYASVSPAVPQGQAKPPDPPPFNPESVPPLGKSD